MACDLVLALCLLGWLPFAAPAAGEHSLPPRVAPLGCALFCAARQPFVGSLRRLRRKPYTEHGQQQKSRKNDKPDHAHQWRC